MNSSIATAALLLVASCNATPPRRAFELSEVSLERRQLQTRTFETDDEARLQIAAAHLLADLGFILEESETELGVIVGTKDRDAKESDQLFLSLFLAAFSGVPAPMDMEQRFKASVVTQPARAGRVAVRITFNRVVKDNYNQSSAEGIFEPQYYEEFFALLSKAVFLEAHQL